jgi:hypothetical protein
MLDVNSQGGEGAAGGGMNPVMKRHLELEIKTLQNTPRYADKVRQLLKISKNKKRKLCT